MFLKRSHDIGAYFKTNFFSGKNVKVMVLEEGGEIHECTALHHIFTLILHFNFFLHHLLNVLKYSVLTAQSIIVSVWTSSCFITTNSVPKLLFGGCVFQRYHQTTA